MTTTALRDDFAQWLTTLSAAGLKQMAIKAEVETTGTKADVAARLVHAYQAFQPTEDVANATLADWPYVHLVAAARQLELPTTGNRLTLEQVLTEHLEGQDEDLGGSSSSGGTSGLGDVAEPLSARDESKRRKLVEQLSSEGLNSVGTLAQLQARAKLFNGGKFRSDFGAMQGAHGDRHASGCQRRGPSAQKRSGESCRQSSSSTIWRLRCV